MVRCPRKVVVCELCAQDCGGFGEGLPMFFVVLCDDVVRELCVRAIHSVSVRVRAREKERQAEGRKRNRETEIEAKRVTRNREKEKREEET